MSETVAQFARALEQRIEALLTAALPDDSDITVKVGDETTSIKGQTVVIRAEEGRQVHPRLNLVEVRLNVVLRAKCADADADDLNAEWATLCGVLDAGDFATQVSTPTLKIYGAKIAPFTHEVDDNTFKKRWVKLVNGYVPIP